MFLRCLCLFVVLASSQAHAGIFSSWFNAGGEPVKTVRVLIGKNLDGAMVEVTGSYNIYDPASGSRLSTAFLGKGKFMQPMDQGIRWGEEFPGVYQIAIVPDDVSTTILVNGLQYVGTVTVYHVEGRLQVVNEVDVEEYLRSTLAAKFDQAIDQEVLNALAIVERTSTYYQIGKAKNPFFDVDAEEVSYHGHAVFSLFDSVRVAVAETKGMIMQHPAAEGVEGTFVAEWTPHSGGHTAPYHLIYRRDAGAPLKGVPAPFAARDSERARWNADASMTELAQIAHLPRVNNVRLYTDRESGKVYKILLEGDRSGLEMDFLSFQAEMGKDRIQSAGFTASVLGDRVIFTGVGQGEGVGLCLYEASKMAGRGDNATQMLAHFFPGAHVKIVRPKGPDTREIAEVNRARRSRHSGGRHHPHQNGRF